MAASTALEAAVARDRRLVAGAIVALTALCWLYLAMLAAGMEGMSGQDMSGRDMAGSGMAGSGMAMAMEPARWTAAYAGLMLAMWVVMMAGMMLPSALPMILTVATIARRRRARGQPHTATSIFVAGYLIAWGAFSIAATAAQWGLEQAMLLSPMMVSTSSVFGGALLIAAGLYQFTPLKYACLRHCRSPADFVLNRWRDGIGGALRMGIEHGLYCLGCCWVAMALLFVFGAMNLLWIAALAILVLLEKAVPGGYRIAQGAGILMLAGGVWMIAS
ncbi:MAG: DUF2182 domain-containing protein [Thalassobaculaceae bacterium]